MNNMPMLIMQLLFVVGCSKMQTLNPSLADNTAPDSAPSNIPTQIVDANSWSGRANLSMPDLNGGRWVGPCVQGGVMTLKFSGSTMKQTGYQYANSTCDGDPTQAVSFTFTVVIEGPDAIHGDAVDADYYGAQNPIYQIMKVSPDFKYMSYGVFVGNNNGTSASRRPTLWPSLSLVRE